MIEVREADLARDRAGIRALWIAYLTWGNDGLQAHYGFRMHDPVAAVDADLEAVAKFQPPNGHLVVASDDDGSIVGVGCVQRLGPEVAEIKRMYVDPGVRRGGVGRRILQQLIDHATADGYTELRLDSPGFMHGAHALYRSLGFGDVAPYAESEIPAAYRSHALFMARAL